MMIATGKSKGARGQGRNERRICVEGRGGPIGTHFLHGALEAVFVWKTQPADAFIGRTDEHITKRARCNGMTDRLAGTFSSIGARCHGLRHHKEIMQSRRPRKTGS